MTDKEMIENLAKFMGWRAHFRNSAIYVKSDSWDKCINQSDITKFVKDWNPLENISDAWEIEEKILEKQFRIVYIEKLSEIIGSDLTDPFYSFNLIHASPRERCNAVIKVIEDM